MIYPTRRRDAETLVMWNALSRKPRARCDNQCFDSGSQGRMNHRRKLRTVIHREFIQPICCLCSRIGVLVRTAYKPEDRRGMPFGPERSEVFAGRCRSCFANPLGAKISTERVNHPLAGLAVVYIERIMIQRRDLRVCEERRRLPPRHWRSAQSHSIRASLLQRRRSARSA